MDEPFEGKPGSRPSFREQMQHEFFRKPGALYDPLVRVFTTSLMIMALCAIGTIATCLTTFVVMAIGKLMGVW
jgi:hypothetical protein